MVNEREYTFKTTTEDFYSYDNEVYVVGQEWRIKELSQLMYPGVTTHALHEVINQIKRRSYVDRSCFDSNIDIFNQSIQLIICRLYSYQ
jgi:hypothetical protein